MSNAAPTPPDQQYDIDQLPPLGEAIPLGIQHVTSTGATC
ncbi:hypothetical protein BH23ACT10_BH23ACT10_23830 [soil metagenome]